MSEAGFGNLVRLVGRDRRRFAMACLCAALGTALAVAPFLLAARLAVRPSLEAVAMLAACLLLQPVLMGLSTAVAHYAAFDLLHTIRRELADKMARLPLGYFSRRQVGAVKRVLNEDVEALELFLSHQLPDMVACLLIPLLILAAVAVTEWRLAVAALGVVPLAYGAQVMMMRGHGAKMGEYFGRIGAINGAAVEYVRGIELIKSTRGGTLAVEGMNTRIEDFRRFAEDWFRLWGIPWAIYAVTAGAAPLFVVPTALWLAAEGAASPQSLVFGLFATTAMGAPLVKLTIYGEITMRVMQAERKIRAIHAAPELPLIENGTPVGDAAIAFDSVHLAVQGRNIIEAASFTVPAHRLTAIVGPSGAGKSTLLRLMQRFTDPDQGCVRLNGSDLRGLPPDVIARRIALVSQDIFLFDDSVAANIRIGRADASDSEVEDAARAALCDDFIRALPDGYRTRLGEGGQRLSGGQRQRLSLARALLADFDILLLDEVSAFVDPWHESRLQQAVGALAGRKTVVVVSHRLDSTAAADHLIFLEQGRVAAQGTHAALLSGSPAYARLWALQQDNLRWDIRAAGEMSA